MLDIGKGQGLDPKCYFAHTLLPHFIDEKQPPTKKKPFSSILAHPFSHTLDIIIPKPSLAKLQDKLADGAGRLQYAKVHMKLQDLIKGDFFNNYIKIGNILMLSEGRSGSDNTFSLHEGTLHIELDRATYERSGLVGKPIPSLGRKHIKSRYAIDINLRDPAMVRGRKAFNRLVYAFDNSLPDTLTWLFCDLKAVSIEPDSPIMAHAPFVRTVAEPVVLGLDGMHVPVFPAELRQEDEVAATDLLEWFALLSLDAPGLRLGDDVDPYLSRYSVPALPKTETETETVREAVQDLVRLRWRGFMASGFVGGIFTAAVKATPDDWFALRAEAFDGRSYTILKHDGQAMTWECD